MKRPNLDELKKLCDAATDGPWKAVSQDYKGFLGQYVFKVIGTVKDEDGDVHRFCDNLYGDDAFFIAASRTALPQCLEYIEHLEATIATLRQALADVEDKQ